MNLLSVFRPAFFVVLGTAIGIAVDSTPPGYQKGTITQELSAKHKSYDLKDGDKGYEISDCGDFQTGQVVDYRVKGTNVFIRREDGKEYKCAIEATTLTGDAAGAYSPPVITYQKGTIGGYEIRKDIHVGGGGNGSGVSTWTRKAKVYELHGADLTYKVDYCGAFQAGKFTPGQVVEYRVDGDRLYIRHDNNKEYSCQLEGTLKPQEAKTEEGAKTEVPSSLAPTGAPAPTAAAPASSTAKLSITSVPDGADIEVDGGFCGSTPSDLQVTEGEHSITVKKSGYKDWERKIKVVAGSNIHLNAEMEKTASP